MDVARKVLFINQIISGYFFYRICENFVTWRHQKIIKIIAFIGCCCLMMLPIYETDMFNVLGELVGMVLLIAVCGTKSPAANLSTVVIFYPMALGMNYLRSNVTPLHIFGTPAGLADTLKRTVFFTICTFLWAAIYYFLKGRLKEVKKYMTAHTYLLIDLLCAAAFTAIFITILFPPLYNAEASDVKGYVYNALPGYIIVIISIVSILAALVLMQKMTEAVKEKMRKQTELMKAEYYHTLEEQQEKTRKLVHDINSHFQMVEGYLRDGRTEDAADYLTGIRSSLPAGSGRRFCQDSAVNALLNSRYTKLLEMHADVHFNIDLGALMGMEPMDLCTVFGNVLDNAIEAAEQMSEEKRKVTFQVRCQNGMFTLREVNSKVNEIAEENGKYLTGKRDKNSHGYGLDNVREIVEKYGGKMEISYTQDEFSLLIYAQN